MIDTETKKSRTPLRLAVMTVMLAVALGATLLSQAQPQDPRGGVPQDPATGQEAGPADNEPLPRNQQGTDGQKPSQTSEDAEEQEDDEPEQRGDATGPDPLSEQPIYRVGQLFMFSPIINGIIGGLSALGLLFFLFFMASINRRTFAPPRFVDEVVKLVIRGDYDRASDVCRRSRGVFAASIVQRCVENPNQEHSVMLDMIDTEGRRQADIIWNRVSYLADISNIAPMLGLVGTVLGMIKAFYGLENEMGGVDAQVLANGIGEAMATTLFGLSVGIVTLVFYSIAKSRATRTLAEAEQAVHMIADHIKREGPPSAASAMHAGRPPLN